MELPLPRVQQRLDLKVPRLRLLDDAMGHEGHRQALPLIRALVAESGRGDAPMRSRGCRRRVGTAAAVPVGRDLGMSMDTKPQGAVTLALPALTLTAPSLLPGERHVPGCDAEAQTRGNSEALGTGLPLMGSLAFQLAPRLSMLAFSRLGCPITSGVGAVMAYEVPVTRSLSLSLSLSGSVYGMPQALDTGVATRGLLRADVVSKDPGGRMIQTWGIQALGAHGTSSTTTVNASYGLHW